MAKSPPPDLPRLKRFANLDIDGVSRPAKAPRAAPKPTPMSARPDANARVTLPPEDANERAARALGAELSDNARTSIGNTRPEAMRQSRAADLSRMRPRDPVPTPPSMRPSGPRPSDSRVRQTTFELRPRSMPEPRVSPALDDELYPPDATPGVITIEIGGRRSPGVREFAGSPAAGSATDPRRAFAREFLSPTAPRARAAAPIEVTPLAARQILLMAWQSGMQGSGLRIFMTRVPGLGGPELDFAFDDHPTPDDVVFESNGIRVLCDAETLAWARGRRVTFHDIPTEAGIGAFRLA